MKNFIIRQKRCVFNIAAFGLLFFSIALQAMEKEQKRMSNIQVDADSFKGVIGALQSKIKKEFTDYLSQEEVRDKYRRDWLQRRRVRYPEYHHITLRGTGEINKDAYNKVKNVLDRFSPSPSVANDIIQSTFQLKKSISWTENEGFPNGFFKRYYPAKSRVVVYLEVIPGPPLAKLANEINKALEKEGIVDERAYPGASKNNYDPKNKRYNIQNPQRGKIAKAGTFSPHVTVAIFSYLNDADVENITKRLQKLNLDNELKNLPNKLFKPLKIKQFSLTRFGNLGPFVYPLKLHLNKIYLLPRAGNKADFLHNDYVAPFVYNNKRYLTVNKAYNQLKQQASDYSLMENLIRCKFNQNPDLQKKLINLPEHVEIINNSDNPYWGAGPKGKGQNKLGKILEELHLLYRFRQFDLTGEMQNRYSERLERLYAFDAVDFL